MALAAVAVLATLFVIPSAQARAATPPGFFGLNFYFRDITAKDVFYLKASGATTVRWIMNWQHIEPKRGTWNWSEPDAVVGDLAAQGIRVLPVMWGSPGMGGEPSRHPTDQHAGAARRLERVPAHDDQAIRPGRQSTGAVPTESSIPARQRCRSTSGKPGTNPI